MSNEYQVESSQGTDRIDLGQAGLSRGTASFNPLDMGMSPFPVDSFFADEPSPVDIFLPYLADKAANRSRCAWPWAAARSSRRPGASA